MSLLNKDSPFRLRSCDSIAKNQNIEGPLQGELTKQEDPKTIVEEIKKITQELICIYQTEPIYQYPIDLLQYSHFCDVFYKMMMDITEDPIKNIKIQENFLHDYVSLCFSFYNKFFGIDGDSFAKNKKALTITKPKDDRRFADPIWEEEPHYRFIKRSYYLITAHTLRWLSSLSTLDRKTRLQVHFYIKNFLDFLCPTNFIATNPTVLQKMIDTGGENLLNGMKSFLQDLAANKGRLNISKTDLRAFKVGKNLAITPGKVIFQNDLIQLIQYLPTTKEVYQTPILFIPPWINKYYILDLSPQNSIVRWLVEQGFTVYMISWVNPTEMHANKDFSDYMLEGPLQALDIITSTTKTPKVHMVGYCIGGTLLGSSLAYMAKKGDTRAQSATFFMSLLDFSNPGELGVFIDKAQLDMLDNIMSEKGYLDGRLLDMTFNLLRPNDLIWPYFINNYLLGNKVKPFDLLYWNADSSNQPQRMYSYYLRNMYLENKLRKPNKIKLGGEMIDLGEIKVPSVFLASKTDHITLWKSVYSGTKLLGGPVEFILTGSGHVRGVINPPELKKYSYFINKHHTASSSNGDGNGKKMPKKANEWLQQAQEQQGSWWPYWANWLKELDPQMVPARDPVQDNIPIIEDAPGSYVKKRL